MPCHRDTVSCRGSGHWGYFSSGAIQGWGALLWAALTGDRSRSSTLSRFAELYPGGFDFPRDRPHPAAEALRIASMSGPRDRFSRKNPHALRPTGPLIPLWNPPRVEPFTYTYAFTNTYTSTEFPGEDRPESSGTIPLPTPEPGSFINPLPYHRGTLSCRGSGSWGYFPSGAIQGWGALLWAALTGDRSRSSTLSRFAELYPGGFDFPRDRPHPAAEALRIASMSGPRDRFSRKNPHALRPTGPLIPPGSSLSPTPAHPPCFRA